MLEEVGLPYKLEAIDLGKQQQFYTEFLKVSSNNKTPAIVDHDAQDHLLAIFESWAILWSI
jgi:GST-like protein